MTNLIQHIELTTGTHPKGTVIWMHGLGADCWYFVPMVKELGLPASLPLRFVFPQAPMRPITIYNSDVMPGWYDISMQEIERNPDEAGVRESQASIDALIEHEIARGTAPDKIILAGFSQGGVIAFQAGLRSKRKLGGIVALSTYLTLTDSLAIEKTPVNAHIPILMAHGTQDLIVPLALGKSSRDQFAQQNYQVDWREYPIEHAVGSEVLGAMGAWLLKRFQPKN